MVMYNLAIKTTSACQGKCGDCSVRAWMKAYPGYQTPIEDIEKLIKYSTEAGYKYRSIHLTGGEPLLWDNLETVTKLLVNSRITEKFIMYTNSLNHKRLTVETMECFDCVQVSKYYGNEKEADEFKARFPERVRVHDYFKRPFPPDKPVPDSLPASCHCQGFSLNHGMVDICGPARTIIIRLGLADKLISVPLQKNFLTPLLAAERENQNWCRYCIGNNKVSQRVPWSRCRVD